MPPAESGGCMRKSGLDQSLTSLRPRPLLSRLLARLACALALARAAACATAAGGGCFRRRRFGRRPPVVATGFYYLRYWTIRANSSGSSDAPPTSAPSISGIAMSSAVLPDFTLPPYWMRIGVGGVVAVERRAARRG